MGRITYIVAAVVFCSVALPLIRRRPRYYWGSLVLACGAAVIASMAVTTGPYLQENTPVVLVIFFIAVPLLATYLLCALPFFRERPIAIMVSAPFFYTVAMLVSINIGMHMRFLRH